MPNRIPAEGKYNFIDLFAGAGGLSEGFIQAGFNPIAHVEMNSFAAQTLVTRSAYYYLKQVKQLDIYYQYLRGEITRDVFLEKIPNRITKTVICETMSNDTLPRIFKTIDGIMKLRNIQSVDVVIGGPPCQAYSLVGRAQSSHMDHPMAEDPRNELYKLYARVLKRYQPRMFVFENVMGISSANEGTTFKNLKKYLRRVGYEIEWHEQKTKNDIDQYLQQVDFWTQVAEPDVEGNLNYWKIDNWGERTFGSHGTLFVGAFCNSNNEMLFPVLLLCDEQGRYIDFTENDIVQALENVNDDDVRYFKPTDEELASYRNIYDTLVQEMLSKYQASSKPVMDYNKRKVENWADIQREQLNIQIAEMNAEIDELSAEATAAKDFLEKVDIRKKVDEKKKQLQKVQTSFHQKVSSIQEEAEREIAEFNQQFDIQPILLVNVVLKF